ncbi:DUF4879 domain-containing protein [Oceanospirillum linum]|uniref:Uncharacterized protein n=1 Tax=Oceanospirillum linum TaxID=966 RepID=A0A1T1HDK3_OCELI|nr:DUF4879 domain-containing protein [Oceanospirillum linum]OOV87893.1 hypothetical protein BTA35_0207840 [Oceanospirillum linum]
MADKNRPSKINNRERAVGGKNGLEAGFPTDSLLPKSANYQDEMLCLQLTGYLDYCSPGQTVAGYLRYYNLDGNQNGQFSYQSTSANFPNNTFYRFINIQ